MVRYFCSNRASKVLSIVIVPSSVCKTTPPRAVIESLPIFKEHLLPQIFVIALATFTIALLGNIWYISIITAVVGLFLGLIHGVGMKIMLEYGTAENTSKYSTINEILVGMGFGLTPIIAGYVVEVYLFGIHWFVTFLGPIVLFLLIFLSRNIKKNNDHYKN